MAIRGDFSVLAAVLHDHLGDMIVWNVKKIGVCPLKGEMQAAMCGLQEANKTLINVGNGILITFQEMQTLAHHLSRWVTSKFQFGGTPLLFEHISNLSWLY